MKSIVIVKSVILGAAVLKPGIREFSIPSDISLVDAEMLVAGGWAVGEEVKAPDPEKEIEIIAAVEQAATKPAVDAAVAEARRPTEKILSAAESRTRTLQKRPPYKKPGRQKG
jgi:hypothetical protein